MALVTQMLVTADDYRLMPDGGPRYQLVEGELFISPAPNRYHQDISRNIEFMLLKYLERNRIGKLYDASKAGVKIKLIIRGICTIVPNLPHLSDTIEAISIVDRFLEHARVLVFHNGGNPKIYLSSATHYHLTLIPLFLAVAFY